MENPAQTWWEWFEARAQGPHALLWLTLVAFLEPIILPLLPEVVMAPLILANPRRWKTYVLITVVFSTLGGVAGYFLGAFFFTIVGPALLSHGTLAVHFHAIEHRLSRHAFIFMLLLMFSPTPDKVFVMLGGFFHVPLIPYTVGFALGRLLRFSLVGYLVHRFGKQMVAIAREYFDVLAVIVILSVCVVALRFFHFL